MPAINTSNRSLIVTFKYNPVAKSPRRRSKINFNIASSPEKKSTNSSSQDIKTEGKELLQNILTPPSTATVQLESSESLPATHKLNGLMTQIEREELSKSEQDINSFSRKYPNKDNNKSSLTTALQNISNFSKISQTADLDWFDQSNTVITNLQLWKSVYHDLELRKKELSKKREVQINNYFG